MVFEEDKSWNWDKSCGGYSKADLECDDKRNNEIVVTENDMAGEEEGIGKGFVSSLQA